MHRRSCLSCRCLSLVSVMQDRKKLRPQRQRGLTCAEQDDGGADIEPSHDDAPLQGAREHEEGWSGQGGWGEAVLFFFFFFFFF